MPQLLEIYEKHGVKSTFFFTGYIAGKFPEIVKMILPYGHEVGCHGLSHKPEEAFDVLSYQEQVRHLKEAKKILEDIAGESVISFRAPALRVNRDTHKALEETGFLIDSSLASQRFDFFLSFGGLKKLKWFFSPRLPYKTEKGDLFRRGDSSIIEVPISALLVPYLGTSLRIMPAVTKIVRYLLHWENGFNSKPVVFVIHPNELIEEFAEKREFTRRAKGLVSYLWSDLLRNKMKLKNLGRKAGVMLEKEIEFLKKRGYRFVTVKEYCKNRDL
ncbi:MAG: polysaccharide deacetylase family protein [Candidatus Cloacimonetes bacterium]|nr:polysaccharide deacetylase family protein [Candidatus Cloacimonadota bacterium]